MRRYADQFAEQMSVDVASGLRCVLDCRASLGESPVWSAAERMLYFVDIKGPALHRYDPATGAHRTTAMPESIGCLALCASGGFIVALRSGIWLARADGALETKIAAAPYDTATHRFNDGRCDRRGRFWVGSINEKRDASTATLERLEADRGFTTVLRGLMISNGLAWSPDGRTMYHADTPTHQIDAYDYDEATGTPSNKRTFIAFDGHRPDGGAVDSDGNYWTALYGSGKVMRISPAGEVQASFAIPAMCPTMCALGGKDFSTLYVTTARQNRPPEELARFPQSGGVFAMRVDVPGIPEPQYAGGA